MLGLLAVGICAGCREVKGEAEPQRSEEEVRLERIGRMDSTLLWTLSHVEGMEGWMADSLARWQERLDSLSAEAWVLVEDSTGLIISAKNADERMYMASITKMMTCLLALENGKLEDSIEITKDVYTTSDARVKVGDGYTVGNMIREMMMLSDNNAAYALALGQMAGTEKVAFYTISHGRDRRHGNRVYGNYLSCLPVLIDTSPEQTDGELLSQTKSQLFISMRNKVYPLFHLLRDLRLDDIGTEMY